MSKKQEPNLYSIEGGHGEPAEPDWVKIFAKNDWGERDMAREHWRVIVGTLRDAGAL